jgi:hypothetical protein
MRHYMEYYYKLNPTVILQNFMPLYTGKDIDLMI